MEQRYLSVLTRILFVVKLVSFLSSPLLNRYQHFLVVLIQRQEHHLEIMEITLNITKNRFNRHLVSRIVQEEHLLVLRLDQLEVRGTFRQMTAAITSVDQTRNEIQMKQAGRAAL